jgi:hypothetical protein
MALVRRHGVGIGFVGYINISLTTLLIHRRCTIPNPGLTTCVLHPSTRAEFFNILRSGLWKNTIHLPSPRFPTFNQFDQSDETSGLLLRDKIVAEYIETSGGLVTSIVGVIHSNHTFIWKNLLRFSRELARRLFPLFFSTTSYIFALDSYQA